jgi:hypothetical protein
MAKDKRTPAQIAADMGREHAKGKTFNAHMAQTSQEYADAHAAVTGKYLGGGRR